MKLSELIQKLVEIAETEGDLPVVYDLLIWEGDSTVVMGVEVYKWEGQSEDWFKRWFPDGCVGFQTQSLHTLKQEGVNRRSAQTHAA